MNNPLKPIQKYFDSLRYELSEYFKKVKSPEFWALGVLLLIWLIVEAPRWQASRVTSTDAEKYFQVENEARKTILQGLGGGFFFVTAYFAWRQVQVAEKNREIADKTRQVAEDKQVTERFVKAAEMLADKERLEVRTAGIYALERIAKDSLNDHWTVMEVLTLLIKNKTASRNADTKQWDLELPTFPQDLQVALTVIGRRDVEKDKNRVLDLSGADLSGADLSGANLSGANLSGANLRWTDLSEADLSGADLSGANLRGAFLSGTNLSGTDLSDANLSVVQLDRTDLSGADLSGADLSWTLFYLTDFSCADLRGANLREAGKLTPEEVREAKNWKKAIYDLNFAEQLGLDKDEQTRRAKEWDESQTKRAKKWDEVHKRVRT